MTKDKNENKIFLTMNVGNLVLLLAGLVGYFFLVYKLKGGLIGVWPTGLELGGFYNWIWLIIGYLSMVLGLFLLTKLRPPEYFYDEAVDLLMKSLNMGQLLIVFIIGGVAEELVFRGIVQVWIGLIPSSIVFMLIHIRYLKKPLMALGTLCLSLILGGLYIVTGSIWPCIIAHIAINMTTAWAIKSGRINY